MILFSSFLSEMDSKERGKGKYKSLIFYAEKYTLVKGEKNHYLMKENENRRVEKIIEIKKNRLFKTSPEKFTTLASSGQPGKKHGKQANDAQTLTFIKNSCRNYHNSNGKFHNLQALRRIRLGGPLDSSTLVKISLKFNNAKINIKVNLMKTLWRCHCCLFLGFVDHFRWTVAVQTTNELSPESC